MKRILVSFKEKEKWLSGNYQKPLNQQVAGWFHSKHQAKTYTYLYFNLTTTRIREQNKNPIIQCWLPCKVYALFYENVSLEYDTYHRILFNLRFISIETQMESRAIFVDDEYDRVSWRDKGFQWSFKAIIWFKNW